MLCPLLCPIVMSSHEIWKAGTSVGFDSNETSQTGAGDAITSTSLLKLKMLYLHY